MANYIAEQHKRQVRYRRGARHRRKPYQWARPLVPVADLPELPQAWIDGFLPIRNKARNDFTPPPISTDDRIIKRAVKYLDAMPESIQGQNGSGALFSAVGALIWGFSLDPATVKDLIVNRFNPRCVPPWSEKEIDHKIQDSLKKPMNKPKGFLLGDDKPKMSWSEFHRKQGESRKEKSSSQQSEPSKADFSSVVHSVVFDGWHLGLTDGKPLVRYSVADEGDDMNILAWEPEVITTIGAPPGSGKSALADQLVFEGLYRNPGVNAIIAKGAQIAPRRIKRQYCRPSMGVQTMFVTLPELSIV